MGTTGAPGCAVSHVDPAVLTNLLSERVAEFDKKAVRQALNSHGVELGDNLARPECWLLNWEDWGMTPRGWDAATLWGNSLAVPALAARVQREYRADLGSRSGLLFQLFFCAEIIAAGDRYAGPLAEPAQREATRLINLLR